ncbi:MAG: hypothetical protein NTZ84_02945 [Candidatus Nealsonbacteria bacterium]|nr:hypothetical protein [Candidatus Nealsonbacteria bacterium]
METIGLKLFELMPPAIIIAVLVYLVKFFGKVISDQKPFSDDRDWEVEISGISFFLITISNVVFFLIYGDFGMAHLFRLIVTILLIFWLWITEKILSIKVYGIELLDNTKKLDLKFIMNEKFLRVNYLVTNWFFPILFFWIVFTEYKSNSLWWTILIGSEAFMGFILLALNYSLNKTKLPKINIFFANTKNPIRNAMLLKYNKDNIRIKQEERVTIINRDFIQKIEFIPNEKIDSKKK